MTNEAEMPRYKCHKEVHALKIESVSPAAGERVAGPGEETDGGVMITPEDPGFAPFHAAPAWVATHNPQAGGYYVVYEDGYRSFSPAKAFEDGYTRI